LDPLFGLSLSPFPLDYGLSPGQSLGLIAFFSLSSYPRVMNRAMDKNMMSHDVGIDATDQDDWDMQRLGKTQQFKVGCAFPGTGP
jgi:hypothetical protein